MAKKKPTVGIDLGGTNIQAGIVDNDGKIIERDDTKTKADQGSDAVIKRLVKLVDGLLDDADLDRSDVTGLGIGAPGAIDMKNGVVLDAPNLGWTDLPLRDTLQKKLKLDVVVDNDVNVGAWGEYKAGAGRGYDDLFATFVGTGIGGGLIFDGKLFHGARFTAGEVGHTVLKADAPVGERSLEHLASRSNIVAKLARLIDANHESMVPGIVDGDMSKVRSKVISQAFKKDDALTVELIRDAANYLGIAIANTVTLLSLPCVVVGGGLTEALGKPWIKLITKSFEEHVFPETLGDTKILASQLEDDAGVIGAALLARDRLNADS